MVIIPLPKNMNLSKAKELAIFVWVRELEQS